MMKFFSSVLSDLCWCFLLFILWTGGERVFTLVAIKRTNKHTHTMQDSSVFLSTKPDNMREPDVSYFFTLRQEIRFDLGDSLRIALIQVWWWNSSVRFLSETSPCVVGVCSCRLWCYLCWCFLLFIFWTGGERVFTLVAIKRTDSQRMIYILWFVWTGSKAYLYINNTLQNNILLSRFH